MLPLPSGTNARAALVESHKRPELIVSGGLGWNARKVWLSPVSGGVLESLGGGC